MSVPPTGFGRGGRGAALQAAFQARQPGQQPQTLPPPSLARGVTPPSLARGVTPPSLMMSAPGPGHIAPGATPIGVIVPPAVPPLGGSRQTEEAPPRPPPKVIGGRGAILANMLQAVQRTQPPSQVIEPPVQLQSSGPPVQSLQPTMPLGRGHLLRRRDFPTSADTSPVSTPSPTSIGDARTLTTTAAATPSPPLRTSPIYQKDPPFPLHETIGQMTIQQETPEPQIQKQGTGGQFVNLVSNHIKFKTRTESAFQYAVHFNPPVDSIAARRGMISEHRELIGNVRIFDGAILYLPQRLPQDIMMLTSTRRTDGSSVNLQIKLTKILKAGDCIQLYGNMLRRLMRLLQMKQVGKYYYDPVNPVDIPQHKLELWPGYISALNECDGGVMLTLDVSHRLLNKQTIHDMMVDASRKSGSNVRDTITRTVVGAIVLTRYNNKTYRIDDIDWDKTPMSTFTTFDGNEITFMQYYKTAYNLDIRETRQPLLIHRPKKKEQARQNQPELICLIPELCCVTGITDEVRADFRVMKDIAQHTRVPPPQRQATLRKFIENIRNNEKAMEELNAWGLEMEADTLGVTGRRLPEEKISVGNNTSSPAGNEADWTRLVTNNRMITPVDMTNWIIVFTQRDRPRVQEFIQMMNRVCPQLGMNINTPQQLELRDNRTDSYLHTIRDHLNPTVQMVVIVFPTSREDQYSAVKKYCCSEFPVPSQVIISKTIGGDQRKMRSVTQKIALQMNCKMGGELWALMIPLKDLMVIGVDVFHDTSKAGRSVVGFVASINGSLTRWYSRVAFQGVGEEIVDHLKTFTINAIRKYIEVNHKKPEKIIMYRDGVGDGQLSTVANYEVEQLTSCFSTFGETFCPKFACIVVQKRINTRVFSAMGNTVGNPPPGTIVDNTITKKGWYDFFLVSQHVRQGTVTPTHYIVVCDRSGLKPDHMQRLSYKLTHLYYNWPGTVRVPAPCQYAHKLAQLCGQSIHKVPAEELSDRLYYL